MFIDTNTNLKMFCLCWSSNLCSLVYKRNIQPKFEGEGSPSVQVSTKRPVRAVICEFHNGSKIVKQTLPSEIESYKVLQYLRHKVDCSCLSTGLDTFSRTPDKKIRPEV